MKRRVAFVLSFGLAAAFASPALAECNWGNYASNKQSKVVAMDKTMDHGSMKTEEAVSTFDPAILDDAAEKTDAPATVKIDEPVVSE